MPAATASQLAALLHLDARLAQGEGEPGPRPRLLDGEASRRRRQQTTSGLDLGAGGPA